MARVALAAGFALLAALAPSAALAAGPRACLVPEGERVGAKPSLELECRSSVSLQALRQEHVAFQIVVESGSEPLDGLTIAIEPEQAADSPPLRFALFLQHFVDVPRRSRTRDLPISLSFSEAARPDDEGMLGRLPDALVPIERAPRWLPYPFAVGPAQRAVLYVEAFVPAAAVAGTSRHRVLVRHGEEQIATLAVEVEVAPLDLPYQATPAFAFYERETLDMRFRDPDRVERELVEMLHAHHLDTMTVVLQPSDVDRLRGALDGSWFRPREGAEGGGYQGPGIGAGAGLLAIGAYGTLGDPSPQLLPGVLAMVERTPPSVQDVFVYAIDETCHSPRGPDWRALLDRTGAPERLRVGHTCAEPPAEQGVDIVMMPAQAFDPELAAEGRRHGKAVWIYNGMLPHAGTPGLDVPLTSLTLNGWIGASFDVGRWFYWETIFWNDKNRGGHGPADVFATAETFHNADGDTSLYDGLLVFPGRMPAAFPEHDADWDGVMPSLRLKSLRRGREDAGLLALAAQVDPDRTFDISRRVVAAALDEVSERSATRLELRASGLAAARAELRSIILQAPVAPSSDAEAVAAGLRELRARRDADRRATGAGQQYTNATMVMLVLPALLFGFGFALAYLLRRDRQTRRA